MSQSSTPFRLRSLCGTLTVATLIAGAVAQPTLARTRTAASPADTLVAAIYFDGKTLDPARQYENLGNAADHAMYDTLVTFAKGDITKAVPDLAANWKISADGKTYTFTLRGGVKFSSGNPLTGADVVFSLMRVANVQGNPSFVLANVASVTAPSASVVSLTLKQPDAATLPLLANPSLSIVDSKTVMANGGSAAATADKTDKAESYLNAHSAGTGPYMLTGFSPGTSVSMAANPNYWGAQPKMKKILLLNQQAPTEKLTLDKGDTDIGLNLAANQLAALKSNSRLTVSSLLSPDVFFLLLNADPTTSAITANGDVRQAIRYALDYKGISTLAGPGSVQTPGVIPQGFLGALSPSMAPSQDVAKAKALLKKAGYANGFTIPFEYISDITIAGQDFNLFAQKIQSDLAAVNITLKLTPKPVAVALPNYRAGKETSALWEWGPDYYDPSDYLLFLPGVKVGLRAGWKAGADPVLERLGKQAAAAVDNAKRGAIYQQIQIRLNAVGPFIPLFQPAQVVATQRAVAGFHFNPIWQADFNLISK